MPALPIIANTFRCALHWSSSTGQNAVNVMHIETTASGKTPLQVFTCLDAHVTAAMWAPVQSACFVDSVAITPLDGISATQVFGTGAGPPAKWSGGTTGDFLPAAAVLIKLTTAHRGRSFRGRVFLPFIGEGATSNGFINSTTANNLSTAWAAFDAAMTADATTPQALMVASYKLAQANPIAALGAEAALGTQRRRQSRNRA